jgi:SHS2 domain-containing protein
VYELFEHTADLGLRVRGADLDGLFRDAADGLFAIIVEEVPPVAGAERLTFRVEGTRRDHLLFDWLNELLYVFDTRHLLLRDFEVSVADDGLSASAAAQPLDERRHATLHEVKAITYHGLTVTRTPDGWLAEVILDI